MMIELNENVAYIKPLITWKNKEEITNGSDSSRLVHSENMFKVESPFHFLKAP